MNIKVDFDNIVVKEDKNDFNVKVLMLKGEKGDAGDGENNVIEEVQVNGTALPVTNKAVNVNVPIVDSAISSSSTNPVQNNTIYNALSNKVDTSVLDNYYQISEVDDLISSKADNSALNNYYTQSETNALLDDKADNSAINTINSVLSTKANISDLANTYETIASHNSDISTLTSQISSLASGSPLVASSTSEMTDTTRVYVNTTDGNWYYYDGSSWVSGGTYQASENSDTVEELVEEVSKKVSAEKLSGYYNITRLSGVTILKNKKIAGYNTTTFEPNIQDYQGGTVIILPINGDYGDYHIKLGTIPSSGHVFCRYTPNVKAALNAYSQIATEQDWATSYDSVKNEFIAHTSLILNVSNTMYAFYVQDVEEPVIYIDNYPTMDSGTLQLKKFIGENQLTDNLLEKVENAYSIAKADILLPNSIYTVIGHEHNIYLWNIYKCNDLNNYYTRVGGAHGGNKVKHLGDCIRITPETAGNIGLTFNLYGYDNSNILEQSITIKKIADNKPSSVKLMVIGDSMVENGSSLAELKNLFGDNLTLYGSITSYKADSNNTSRELHHEGRSGWSTNEYLNNSTYNNKTNAFFNPSINKFDFSYYMNNYSAFNDVTDVIIQLGNNDIDRVTESNYISNLNFMINSIKTFNSDINVYVCIPSPVSNDQFGYGDQYYTHRKYQRDKLFDYGKALLTGITNASLIPIYQNLDCINDFDKKTVALSSRNPQTVQIISDNVHPSKYGFYKFADTMYCAILGKYSEN